MPFTGAFLEILLWLGIGFLVAGLIVWAVWYWFRRRDAQVNEG